MTASDTESDWSQEDDVISDLAQKIALEEDDQVLKMKGSPSTAIVEEKMKWKTEFKNSPAKLPLPQMCHEIQSAFPEAFIPRIFSMSLLLNCRRRPRNTQSESAMMG